MRRGVAPARRCLRSGDGYQAVSWGGDCDDTNTTVYPGAPELADGLDNDCGR